MKPTAPAAGPTAQHVAVFRLTHFPLESFVFRDTLEAATRDTLERALRYEKLPLNRRAKLEQRLNALPAS